VGISSRRYRSGRTLDRDWCMYLLGLHAPWLRPVIHTLAFLKHEVERHQPIPLRLLIRDLRQGFWSDSHVLYDLARNAPDDYLSDYAHISRARYLNGIDGLLLRDKLWFDRAMQPFPEYMPRLHGTVHQGRFHPIPTRHESRLPLPASAAETIRALLASEHKLILKPARGAAGLGVTLLTFDSGQYRRDGLPLSEAALGQYVGALNHFLVQEFVVQDEFPASIFPDTTNTIRILTMWDDEAGEPFCAAACHRFGRRESVPVDNTCRGGLTADIDLARGELGTAAPTNLTSPRLTRYDVHPDSGVTILGRTIPRWEETKRLALSLASHLSFIPYIGWDIVLSADSAGFKILEANDFCGSQVLQTGRPLLEDKRVRSYYERQGVVHRRA